MHLRTGTKAAQDAVRNTQDCEAICVQTVQYCLETGGEHADPQHNKLLQDCADICEATTKILLRGSHTETLAACASLCEQCAASCDRFAGDAQMKACANQCRLCAQACRQSMAGAGLHAETAHGMTSATRMA